VAGNSWILSETVFKIAVANGIRALHQKKNIALITAPTRVKIPPIIDPFTNKKMPKRIQKITEAIRVPIISCLANLLITQIQINEIIPPSTTEHKQTKRTFLNSTPIEGA